jgi:hypothetical protein
LFHLEDFRGLVYLAVMSQTLEMRVKNLEEKVAALASDQPASFQKKDWRRSIGIFKDDPDFEEAVRLGREFRQRQKD